MAGRARLSLDETPEARSASDTLFPDLALSKPELNTMRSNFQARKQALASMAMIAGPDTYAARPAYGVARPNRRTRRAGRSTAKGLRTTIAPPSPPDVSLSVDEISTTAGGSGGPIDQTIARLNRPSVGGLSGDSTIARALGGVPASSSAPAFSVPAGVVASPPSGSVVRSAPVTEGEKQTAASPDEPAPKRPSVAATPAAVPTPIPTAMSMDEDEDEDEPERNAPITGPGGMGRQATLFQNTIASVFGSLLPSAAAAATAPTKDARRAADTNLAVNVGAQLADAVVPGSGGLGVDLVDSSRKRRGANQNPAALLKTGADAAKVLSRQTVTSTPPVSTPQAAEQPPPASQPSPPPQTTAPPPPDPTSSSPPTAPKVTTDPEGAAEGAAEGEAEQSAGKGLKRAGVKAATSAGEEAAGDAAGEAAGEAALGAIPGVGEIAAGVLGLVSILGMTKKPRNLPAPPPASAQAFQAGL